MPLYKSDHKKPTTRVGSTITVTTPDSELYGRTVTVTDGTDSLTGVFSISGVCIFKKVMLLGTLTISSTASGGKTASEIIKVPYYGKIEVELELSAKIYGVYWDGSSSPAMTRTDSAANFSDPIPAVNNGNGSSPFDNILPWSGMQIVDDNAAGKLVSIPKYYYKWTKNGSSMKLQISMEPFDGSHVSPAHANRGDGKGERDVVYVGRYHCATSTYKSTSGVAPKKTLTISNFRTYIHNLGSTIWQWDYAMVWTIRMLYLVEFANWNSQLKIGYGDGNGSGVEYMGYTDNMAYHTGTTQSSRTTFGLGTQYRYIEGLWDNLQDMCDGIYFIDTQKNVAIVMNPSDFGYTASSTKIGTTITSTSGYISSWYIPTISGFEWALYPLEVNGSSTSHVTDRNIYHSAAVGVRVGGNYSTSMEHGLFFTGIIGSASADPDTGSRLMKLP